MVDTSDNILLSEEEAAALLQPHMRKESVTAWLANDRQNNPSVPFILLRGEPYYREADLVFFITHTLNSQARFIRVREHLNTDLRKSSERRRQGERRRSRAVHLWPGIERRQWRDTDRRMSRNFDRRAQHAG